MSMLSASIGGTRRFVVGLGQYGLLLGPVRRALVEPGAVFSDELMRLLICYYGRCLWDAGLIAGACGNLSARTHKGAEVFITPRAANKSRLAVTDVHLIPGDVLVHRGSAVELRASGDADDPEILFEMIEEMAADKA